MGTVSGPVQILDVTDTFGLHLSIVSLRSLIVCAVACLSVSPRGGGDSPVVRALSASPRGGGDSPVVRAMSKAVAWTPVQVKTVTAISGGVGRKHHVLSIERFDFEDRETPFVVVSPNEAWLCEVVAGQCASRRPLSRSGIFKRLRDALSREEADCIGDGAAKDDRMQELSSMADDSQSSSPSPPAKSNKRSRNVSYKGVMLRKVKVPANLPAVPAVAGNAGQPAAAADREVLAAIKMNKLFIAVDDLSWLVCYLRCEFEAGFVPAVVSAPAVAVDTSGSCKLWWDFRDECWVGRVPQLTGDRRRRLSKSVRARMTPGGDLHHMTFEDAKAFCYNELAALVDSAEATALSAGLPLAAGECVAAAAAMS